MMRFRCKECGALHEIPDERLGKGKRVRCQRCKAITVVRPGDADPDPPTRPRARVPDLDEGPDAEPDMEAPTRIATVEDVMAAGAAAEPDMDASTRVATRDEMMGGAGQGLEMDLDASTRVASTEELMAAGASPLPTRGHDDDDDGIEAYDAVDWETRPTVEGGTVDPSPVPVQPLAAEVPQDDETVTAPGGAAPKPQPADPSLSETLFSDSVMEQVPDASESGVEFGAPAQVTVAPRPAAPAPAPAAFSSGASVSSGGHKLLWFLAIVAVLGAAAFGAMMVFPELGFLPDSGAGRAVAPPVKADKPKPKPRSSLPPDEVSSEPLRLPGKEQAPAAEQAAGFLELAEQAEARGEVLEARLLAAASLVHRDAEEARDLMARLDEAPRPRLEWRSRPGAVCTALAQAADGSRLACAASDAVLVWDMQTGREIRRLDVGGEARAVAISPDGGQLAAGGADRVVRLWSLRDEAAPPVRLGGHRQPVTALAYSADGTRLASGSEDRSVRLWNAHDGTSVTRLSGHRKPVTAVVFSSDGSRLYSASRDRTIREWDLAANKKLRELKGHDHPVLSLALSASGTLASGAAGGVVRLWKVADAQDPGRALDAHQGAVNGLAFLGDGTLASAGADGQVKLWQADSGAAGDVLEHGAAVLALSPAAGGARLAVAGQDGTVLVWQPSQGRVVARLSGAVAPLTAADISPDGRLVAATGEDGALRVWPVQTGLEKALRPRPDGGAMRSVRFAPDSKQLAVAFGDSAELYSYPNMKSLGRFDSPADVLAFTPDGTKLAVGGSEPSVVVWDIASGDELLRLEGPERGITALTYGPGGTFLVAGSKDGTARIWYLDSDDSAVRSGTARDPVTSLAFTGRTGQVVFGTELQGIRRWLLARAIESKPLRLGSAVRALAASPDGRRFASGDDSGRVILWDLKEGEVLVRFTAHRDAVNGLDFSEDGTLLASASADGTLRLWRFLGVTEVSGKRRSGADLLAFERTGSRMTLVDGQPGADPSLFSTAFSVSR